MEMMPKKSKNEMKQKMSGKKPMGMKSGKGSHGEGKDFAPECYQGMKVMRDGKMMGDM